MRLVYGSAVAVAVAMLVPAMIGAQAPETARPVAGGGVTVPGWTGKSTPAKRRPGRRSTTRSSRRRATDFHVTTGPAVTYWNPANKAAGNYTVKATFNEPKYMELNDHPHPYGIMIAGNDLGTPTQSYLYCAAYGNGNFIVRGFGPEPFQINGRRGEANAAVKKAAAPGEPVTQEIAVSVKGDRVECSINGTVVAGYDKPALVAAGKLKSTDGIYGLRFAHNTEAVVSGFTMTKN